MSNGHTESFIWKEKLKERMLVVCIRGGSKMPFRLTHPQMLDVIIKTVNEYWHESPKHQRSHNARKVLLIREFSIWILQKKRNKIKGDVGMRIINALWNSSHLYGFRPAMGRTTRIYYFDMEAIYLTYKNKIWEGLK